MRNYFRALKQSWPYRTRLIISVGCALAVAALWSINLSAVFPVLTILAGDRGADGSAPNLQTWVDAKIVEYQQKADNPDRAEEVRWLRTEIQRLQDEPPSGARENVLRDYTRRLARVEGVIQDFRTQQSRHQFLKTYIIRHLPTNRFETFVWIMAAVVVGVALKGFFEFWQEVLVGSVVCRTLYDFRNRFYRAVVHQDTRQIAADGTPELMARVTNDTEQIGVGMRILYGRMVVEPLRVLFSVAVACWINWQLTLLFVFLVPPALYTLTRVSRKMKKASRKVLERMTELYRILRETFDGIRVVKAFTMEPAERRRFRLATQDYYDRSMRVVRIDAFAGPMVELFGILGVGTALVAGAYLVMEGETHIAILGMRFQMTDEPMTFSTLVTLYAFLASIADPVRKLSSVYTKIQTGAVAADRVFSLVDRVPKVTANAGGPIVPRHAVAVEFRNVCFSYVPGQDPGTLNNIDLIVRAGETVAVVGPNGCGKSTLLGLLARFFDPDHGSVYVDGVNLRAANLRSLRKQIGLVTQDTVLFNDTIAANIAYGRHGATPEQVEMAARQAFAHEFVVTKPAGYAEPVGDSGSQLSGGQKQRLALARAILRDPRILILDEFTSQIDAESEAKIHQALREFVKGRTTFLVTHRLSTLELADRIVVMDVGRIVAVGRHPDLLAGCPTYRRLYEAQVIAQGGDVPVPPDPPPTAKSNGVHKAA